MRMVTPLSLRIKATPSTAAFDDQMEGAYDPSRIIPSLQPGVKSRLRREPGWMDSLRLDSLRSPQAAHGPAVLGHRLRALRPCNPPITPAEW